MIAQAEQQLHTYYAQKMQAARSDERQAAQAEVVAMQGTNDHLSSSRQCLVSMA
jgi:hypothetical protein